MLPTVLIVGRLTRDPQLSYTPNQVGVVDFGVAASTKIKDKDRVCFLDVRAFGKTGEFVNKYFKKGKPVHLSGTLQTDQWEAQDGSKRSKTYCVANQVAFVPQEAKGEPEPRTDDDDDDDDIPF